MESYFLSADFYKSHLAENDVYNRLYDAVLVPRIEEQLDEEGRADFIGGLRVERENVDGLVKGIFPPPELRRQVEGAIEGAVEYLNKEEDPATGNPIETPNVYIEFGAILGPKVPPPLGVFPEKGMAKPVIYDFLIEEYIEFLPSSQGFLQVEVLSAQLEEALNKFQDPTFPIEVPSLAGIPIQDRVQVYDRAKELFFSRAIPQEIKEGLEEADADIKAELFGELDADKALKKALKVAIEHIVAPLIDEGFNDFRDDQLDPEDRFDPIGRLAENRGETKEKVLERTDDAREWLDRGKTLGTWIAILVIALGSIVMGVVHLPRIRSALGWPGLTLLLSGALFLGLAILLKSQLPDRLESFLDSKEGGCSGVADPGSTFSPELCGIAVDVARSMAGDVAGGFIAPSIVILVIGGGLVLAALVADRVVPRA